jgi:hypothetical protein
MPRRSQLTPMIDGDCTRQGLELAQPALHRLSVLYLAAPTSQVPILHFMCVWGVTIGRHFDASRGRDRDCPSQSTFGTDTGVVGNSSCRTEQSHYQEKKLCMSAFRALVITPVQDPVNHSEYIEVSDSDNRKQKRTLTQRIASMLAIHLCRD